MSRAFAEEMYFCLGCLACMSACPAGVNYAELFERARAEAEESGVLASPTPPSHPRCGHPLAFRRHGPSARSGPAPLASTSGSDCMTLVAPLRPAQASAPPLARARSHDAQDPAQIFGATHRSRYASGREKTLPRGLLTGCAQDLMFSDINRDTVDVLARNGCDVVTPPRQSLLRLAPRPQRRTGIGPGLARRTMIDHFHPNSSTPSSPTRAAAARTSSISRSSSRTTRSIASDAQCGTESEGHHEWLMPDRPRTAARHNSRHQVRHLSRSCHLSHGQKDHRPAARTAAGHSPSDQLVELPEAIGAAAAPAFTTSSSPKWPEQLLRRKLANIKSTGATVVATGNPGCLAHMTAGLRQQGLPCRLVHPVTLLAEAYRFEG